jgi:spore germination cell wall hydrolase CwlJ-like protein
MYSIAKKAIILAILIIISKASFAESLYDESEKTCLAKVIYHETRGEPLSGKKGVAKVVLNRKSDKHFPKTVCSIVNEVTVHKGRKVCQFSWVCTRPKIKWGSAEWKNSLELSNDILSNKVSLPDFGSNVLFFRSIYCRRGFGRGNYKLVSKLGKTNFYTKKIA